MLKQTILFLALVALSFASEEKQDYDYKDQAQEAHLSGYYYPQYGYYPYYNPAPYYYYPGYYGNYYPYYPYEHHYQPHAPQTHPGLVFIGKFEGTCRGAANGIYYVDDRSFAFCSNGIKTIQSCADGSANPTFNEFKKGKYYRFTEFCSINLVSQQKVPGYSAHKTAEVKQQEKAAHH